MPDPFFLRFPLHAPCWRKCIVVPELADARRQILSQVRDCLPPPEQVFAALDASPLREVRVLILGQDPYPRPGDAHGLAFSVQHGQAPPSLRNIFKEVERDCGGPRRSRANLSDWAEQGVLLLNHILTTSPGMSNAHRGLGWEKITQHLVRALVARPGPLVLMLWGRQAIQVAQGLTLTSQQLLLCSHHPSPLSYHRRGPQAFCGCGHFAAANRHLAAFSDRPPIDWVGCV